MTEPTTRRPANRRERLRAELDRDIRAAACALIVKGGVDGMTLADVARAVGVTPPALYRYYGSKAALVAAVYEDLSADLLAAVSAAAVRQVSDDISAQLHAATRAVVEWSVAQPAAFDLVMGSGYRSLSQADENIPRIISRDLGGLFGGCFDRLWREGSLTYLDEGDIAPDLARQLHTYRSVVPVEHPLGVTLLMLRCWRQIYGLTCLAVYGHMEWTLENHTDFFEQMMEELLGMLNLTVSPALR
ncbi:TetR/AcrR family transcriptional regulator [Streptomyces sp. NPDC051840]|uniref:TetR/AcrR family transcriptional regulator n=1 Tax=unclassified Streptomyces TaxID=2593676 RepID=UPI00341394FF